MGQLRSGPMLGYNTMKEVVIWLQTVKPQKLILRFKEINGNNWEETIGESSVITANTAHLVASNLEPGTKYEYQIFIEGEKVFQSEFTTQVLWQHRTDPPDFSFAVGSCAYINQEKYDRPGQPYGGSYEIFETIASQKLILCFG